MAAKRDAAQAFGESKTSDHIKRPRRSRKNKTALTGAPREKSKGHSSKRKHGKHAHQKAEKKLVLREDEWSLSRSCGGVFLEQDPILTTDGRYLILPTRSDVQIYSSSTSLLVRTLQISSEGNVFTDITSCMVSPTNQNELFISTWRGLIARYDWTTGRSIRHWHTQKGLLRCLGFSGKESEQSLHILSLYKTEQGRHQIIRRNLGKVHEDSQREGVLLTLGSDLVDLKRLGNVLVVCSGNKLLVGQSDNATEAAERSPYLWREVVVPSEVVSMDARNRQEPDRSGKGSRMALDVVIGFQDGAIIIYEDILFRLIGREKGIKDVDILSRRLHWHRGPANTVKWSRDGNYLISGGNETVLVIWQLDTNQQQFLPHLSTPILNLSVSQAGSSYALQLADNSVMVLSTADFVPSANVSGLALGLAHGTVPAVLSPAFPGHLIAAVPGGCQQSHRQHATQLQTFDIMGRLQVSRQALTRNVITMINVGPAGQKVAEPTVVHLKVSNDGKWLVTVDEWIQPISDLEPLRPRSEANTAVSRETSLRFWAWHTEKNSWELVTRVDEPHSTYTVLALAVHPTRSEVVTIGGDVCIRSWSPKARYRSGVIVKNQDGGQLRTWTCSYVRPIEREIAPEIALEAVTGALAYSADGSVIAASWSTGDVTRLVHFLDSRTGTVRSSQSNLLTAGPAQIAFLGRSLLCLSKTVCIWDTVSLNAVLSMSLSENYVREGSIRLLAINPVDSTFVLALNPSQRQERAQLAVFDINKLRDGPMFQTKISGRVKLLLSRPKEVGFVLVDDENRIRYVSPPGLATSSAAMVSAEPVATAKGLDNIFGSGEVENISRREDMEDLKALPAPVSRAGMRSLDELLGSQASSTQTRSVGDLFEKVAGLFTRAAVAVQ